MAKTNAVKATPPVTFDMNDPVFQQIVAQAVAVRLAASKQGSVPKNTIVDGKTEGQLKLDVLVCKTFKRAGFGEVKPRVDVRTFNKWLAEGYRVKPGEKATKVRQFRLFHKTQVQYEGQSPKEQAPAEVVVAAVKAAKAATVTQTVVQRLKGKGGNPSQPSLV